MDDDVSKIDLLPPGPDNPRNSEGTFVQLADGRILFVYSHYYGDNGADHGAAFLAGRESGDQGRTWSRRDVTIVPNEGKVNVMSASLLRLQDGSIALFYIRKDGKYIDNIAMRVSHDEGQTWSPPADCITDESGYYVLNNDRAVQLSGGRLVLPVAQHRREGDPEDSMHYGRAMCYLSDDNGRTWRRSRSVLELQTPPETSASLMEPGVVELTDGRLLMFCRTSRGTQHHAYSSDQGETWSQPLPGPIPSPNSPASMKRIPSTGDLLLVWNNNPDGRGPRTPFNCAVSSDEGQSWQHVKTLADDPDGWYCYTAIEFVGDVVLLAHCAGKSDRGKKLATTRITRLPVRWLYE